MQHASISRARYMQENRKMRFQEAFDGWSQGRLTQAEAALLLGQCERSFRRHIERFEADGLEGLLDKRLSQISKRRGKHRIKRERAPLPGMMLHQDASTHRWVANAVWDLVVTMDDATSEHTSMFFCEQEGTASSFHGIGQTIANYGLFASLYSDRGSHYFTTPEAGSRT
jgi:Winged helix-turn helix